MELVFAALPIGFLIFVMTKKKGMPSMVAFALAALLMRNDNYNSFSGDSYFSRLFWGVIGPFLWRFLGLFFCFRWRRVSAAGGEGGRRPAPASRPGYPPGL